MIAAFLRARMVVLRGLTGAEDDRFQAGAGSQASKSDSEVGS